MRLNSRSWLMLLWTIVWTAIGAMMLIVDVTGRLFMYFARVGWAPQVLWLGGVRVERLYADGIDWKRPYVVVANHQSQVDIPILFAFLPTPIRFLAKRSLFFIPVFGWSMWGARFIPVDRSSSRKSRRSIDRAAVKIRRGPSLVVFPEGTRTADGGLLPFKSGAFVIAVKAGVPVLPVAILGSFEVLPRSRLAVKPSRVRMIVGSPIPTGDRVGAQDKDVIKGLTRERIAEMLRTGRPI